MSIIFTKKEAVRIFPYISIDKTTQCWNWTRKLDNGYGRIWFRGKRWRVYRLLYLWKFLQLPKWKSFADPEIDHLCNNRACVNPDHLKLTDHKKNILRGNGPTAINSRKTLCIHGHPLPPTKKSNGRHCKVCNKIYMTSEKRKAYKRKYYQEHYAIKNIHL
jgi:hypothetical protein